jgi:hypothetical protein
MFGRVILTRGKPEILGEILVPLLPPQMQDGPAWNRIRVFVLRGRSLNRVVVSRSRIFYSNYNFDFVFKCLRS